MIILIVNWKRNTNILNQMLGVINSCICRVMLQFYSCTFRAIKILLVFNGFPENSCIIVNLKA